MKAAVLEAAGAERPYAASAPLTVRDLERPEPRAGELRVRISYASLCHSDLSVVDGSRVRPLPMVLGHEAVGTVDALGDGVADLKVGQSVVLVFVPSCGRCRRCEEGRPALCDRAAEANGTGQLLTGAAVLRAEDGSTVHHHLGVSAFAEYAVVSRESVVAVPDDIPHEVAVLLGCAALTGMGAVRRTVTVTTGQRVAVFGLGAVGLSAVMAAAAVGAEVTAVDLNPGKHPLALAAGARRAVTPDEVVPLAFDVVVEAVGIPAVLEAAFAALDRGGALVTVGLPAPGRTVTLSALDFAGQGKRILGSYMGDADPVADIPHYLTLWRKGLLPLELLHTDTRPLSQINDGLDALADGVVVRRLFRPGG